MTASIPTLEDVLMLPAALKTTVTPDFIDINGHMNVRHYLDLNVSGTLALVELIAVQKQLTWAAPTCGVMGIRS